jgi:hypothetical protein
VRKKRGKTNKLSKIIKKQMYSSTYQTTNGKQTYIDLKQNTKKQQQKKNERTKTKH